MKLNVFYLFFIAGVLAANTYTQTTEEAKKASLSNAEAFDAFAKSIEELMTKQHGEQHFNDQLTGLQSDSILYQPPLASQAELDSLLLELQKGYTHTSNPVHRSPYTSKKPVSTLSYESKPREQVHYETEHKKNRDEARKEAEEAKKPKKCSSETPNGTICPGGKCYDGVCKVTQKCVDDCCDDDGNIKLNGAACAGGECSAGVCIPTPKCLGECCDKAGQSALVDGTKCSVGVCSKGGCIAEKTGCVSGACCDEVNGIIRPKGFVCAVNSCQVPSNCTGFSPTCPDTIKVDDGTYCEGGFCQSGVCVKTIDTTSKDPMCSEGECCDVTTFSFKTKGTPCSNNECQSGATCMGNSAMCPPPTTTAVPAKDASKCSEGSCFSGFCKPHVECEEGECCRAGRMLANYTSCSEGRCFLGKCVYDKVCIGDCCGEKNTTDVVTGDEHVVQFSLENGTPCKGGICLAGRCRAPPPCFGDCCVTTDDDKVPTTAIVDGVPCNHGNGQCLEGICISPKQTCDDGQCCNVFKGVTFPAGFPCHADPCKKSMPCFGNSSVCISSTELKLNGYPCPGNGTCTDGVCIIPPPIEPECKSGPCCDTRRGKFAKKDTPCGTDVCKEQTYCTGTSSYCPISMVPIEDGIICKQTLLGNWTCIEGVCEKPLPKPVLPRCNVETACCDTFKMRVQPNGTLCAEALSECMFPAYCDGFDAECPVSYKPDGSVCSGGMCVHGQCILGVDPTDDDTTHEIHVHHTRDGISELITITTTRKSDGSTITKEVLIETDQLEAVRKLAEQKATQQRLEEAEKKREEKLKIRGEQFEKDVNDTMRRIVEEEQKKIDNMSRAELEEYNKSKNATATNSTSSATSPVQREKSAEELEDETSEHENFVQWLDHEKNPYRQNRYNNYNSYDTGAYQQCGSGLCCNKYTNTFFGYGHVCGQPANTCQVAICSGESSECYPINVVDGFRCPGGSCFDGECIGECYGECCEEVRGKKIAKADGETCDGTGKCFNGVCVRECYGDCCEIDTSFAKPDGAPCMGGTCESGRCSKDATEAAAGGAAAIDPLNGQRAIAVIIDDKSKESELEKLWGQFTDQEHKEEAALKAKQAARKQTEHEAQLKASEAKNASEKKELLQAATDAAATSKNWMIGIIAGAGVVGVLLVVLVVVAIVSSSRKKQQAKKDAQDSEYYYEKF